jgi:hypothetical protein
MSAGDFLVSAIALFIFFFVVVPVLNRHHCAGGKALASTERRGVASCSVQKLSPTGSTRRSQVES